MKGLACDDCEVITKVLINCEGCPYVVCRSCYEHEHSGHHQGGDSDG